MRERRRAGSLPCFFPFSPHPVVMPVLGRESGRCGRHVHAYPHFSFDRECHIRDNTTTTTTMPGWLRPGGRQACHWSGGGGESLFYGEGCLFLRHMGLGGVPVLPLPMRRGSLNDQETEKSSEPPRQRGWGLVLPVCLFRHTAAVGQGKTQSWREGGR